MSYPSKYRPEFCQKIVELGKQGYGIYAYCAECEVNTRAIYEWADKYEEFGRAFDQARMEARRYIESQILNNLKNKDFNVKAVEWMGKYAHSIVENRKLRCGITKDMSFVEQARLINDAAERGDISVEECNKMSQAVANAAKVEENAQLKAELTRIKQLLLDAGIQA